MRGAWKRFWHMPDTARAWLLAKIAGVCVLVLLYALGGVSLYLRKQYLSATPTPPPPRIVIVGPTAAPVPSPEPEPTEKPSPTLYPTITPSG